MGLKGNVFWLYEGKTRVLDVELSDWLAGASIVRAAAREQPVMPIEPGGGGSSQ